MHDQIIGFRLSPQQKHLWSLKHGDAAYRAQCSILLEGQLDARLLREALRRVVARHEILRTTFHQIPGIKNPIQVINESDAVSWQEDTLNAAGADGFQEARVKELLRGQALSPFDYEQGPVVRALLLALSTNKHLLILTLPSLCADSRTLKNIANDLSQAYGLCCQGEEPPPDEILQYVQFSEWQNELLEGEDAEDGIAYWRRRYASPSSALTVPFEKGPYSESTFEPDSVDLVIGPDVVSKMESLALEHNTSSSVFLLTCWQALLWRVTGQSDVIVHNIDDGRKFEEMRGAAGLFAKALPIRCSFQKDSRFNHALTDSERSMREALQWQEYFSREQGSETDDKVADTYFSSVAFEAIEWSAIPSSGGVSFSLHKQYACFDRFKLKLSCVGKRQSLAAEFHYDPEIFNKADVERLAGQFETFLQSAIKNPEAVIGELELLNDAERRRLVVEWNETKSEYPRHACVHSLFENQVGRTPNRIAVRFENDQLSYGGLNARANQVAHYLRGLGVATDVPVGILADRSVDMVVGIWGILKAGGAYVPLDPSYPRERIAYIAEDARMPVILAQQRLVDLLPETEARIVCLDNHWRSIAAETTDNPPLNTTAENLAYVIYTSGSTGRPKGVMVSHRGLVNYLSWCMREYAAAAGQSAPVHSPLGFDLTVTSLFAPLMSGRAATLLAEGQGVEELLAALRAERDFSLIKITPAHLEMLSQAAHAGEARDWAKAIIIGGDALFAENLSFWITNAPDTRLINEYGPTETVVGCCVYEVPGGAPLAHRVPIGRPIANTRLYVLDARQRPAPTGLPGELYIGGDGLARGYLNRSEMTAEKFVPDPFSGESGERLYRSGDLVRYLPDGNIEYLGRIDNQVKVRGFRIELGEIEAVICQHPSVQEAAVLAREDEPGDKRLVAYVVPRVNNSLIATESRRAQGNSVLSAKALRDYLNEKLPHYMVPSAFMIMKSLPLTANGKVDRGALPRPDEIGRASDRVYIGPRDLLELQLVQIWEELLGVQPIGVKDDFFKLGGHSMLAARLMARIRQLTGMNLPVAILFNEATVEHLAHTLRQKSDLDSRSPTLVKIRPGQSSSPFFGIHPGGGDVLCYVGLARLLDAKQPFYGLRARGLNKADAAHTRIEDMAAHYIEAIREVQSEGPYMLGGWSLGGVIAFEMAHQLQARGEEVSLLFLMDSVLPEKKLEDIPETAIMSSFALAMGLPVDHLISSPDELRQMSRDEQLTYVLAKAKEANRLPPDLELHQIRHLYKMSNISLRAILDYVPRPYSRQVTLIRPEEDIANRADTVPAWEKVCVGGLKIHKMPGTHLTMVREPNVKILAEILTGCIESAIEESSAVGLGAGRK